MSCTAQLKNAGIAKVIPTFFDRSVGIRLHLRFAQIIYLLGRPIAGNSPPDGYGNPKTLVVLRFFEAMKKSGMNAVQAIPLVHKQNPKRHHYGTNIPKERMYYNDPSFL